MYLHDNKNFFIVIVIVIYTHGYQQHFQTLKTIKAFDKTVLGHVWVITFHLERVKIALMENGNAKYLSQL